MSVLAKICDDKREHVEARKQATTREELKDLISAQPAPRGFIQNIKNVSADGVALITEVKKASPSKGVIREDFNPVRIAKIYEDNGATCLSVLTDAPYFQGSDEYFKTVRQTVSLPMLRKDFMIDPYQIYESRALGADCILIIIAALELSQAQELSELGEELGMDVLVEVHNEAELETALSFNPHMIGVNNRNLKTLDVDVETSFDLLSLIPDTVVKIAESGISDSQTIKSLQEIGYDGFLVGESLMRQTDIGSAVRKLLRKELTHKEN